VALLALLWAGGCAAFRNDEPNFRDEAPKWEAPKWGASRSGEMKRPVTLGGDFGGVSAEAQQIERNLGIR
jgi:hypothetical protein